MWRELITELTRDVEPIGDLLPGPDFFPGATPEELAAVESALGVRLPSSLIELLSESNGVFVIFGQHFIWSTDEMLQINLQMRNDLWYRETYGPFDDALFFADAGTGDYFFFAIIQGRIQDENVYAWYPIGNERELKAPSLRGYVEGWLTGQLSV
jgi:hypothetical protein